MFHQLVSKKAEATSRGGWVRSSYSGLACLALASCLALVLPAQAAPGLAPTSVAPEGSFGLEPDNKEFEKERQEVEEALNDLETQWNAHNLDAVMKYYDDDYVNNDGLDKAAVKDLTKDFWKTYPDAKSYSKTKQIRVEGGFATVESRDRAVGSTAKEMPGIGSKGVLTSISEGQLYLRKLGRAWRIVGDRIDYEKVKVAFGLAKELETSFVAPEQVKSGQEYSARLDVALPPDMVAVGSITSEPLQYPQPQHKDIWRALDDKEHNLERIIHANTTNHNELLMATVGITDKSRSNLRGLTYLTRRLNVIPQLKPVPGDEPNKTQTANRAVTPGQFVDLDEEIPGLGQDEKPELEAKPESKQKLEKKQAKPQEANEDNSNDK